MTTLGRSIIWSADSPTTFWSLAEYFCAYPQDLSSQLIYGLQKVEWISNSKPFIRHGTHEKRNYWKAQSCVSISTMAHREISAMDWSACKTLSTQLWCLVDPVKKQTVWLPLPRRCSYIFLGFDHGTVKFKVLALNEEAFSWWEFFHWKRESKFNDSSKDNDNVRGWIVLTSCGHCEWYPMYSFSQHCHIWTCI